MRTFFVTGTDTDCGKTWVSCALLDYFRAKGLHVAGFKPLASGCHESEGVLQSEDALALARFGALTPATPWRFREPVAPHIAAREAGVQLDAQELARQCRDVAHESADLLLIEGAGGLMVPLNLQETWLDFLTISKIPVILVVGMRLGCLNHALLSAEVLKSRRITAVGWIANHMDPHMQYPVENRKTLEKMIPFPLLAEVPWKKNLMPLSALDALVYQRD